MLCAPRALNGSPMEHAVTRMSAPPALLVFASSATIPVAVFARPNPMSSSSPRFPYFSLPLPSLFYISTYCRHTHTHRMMMTMMYLPPPLPLQSLRHALILDYNILLLQIVITQTRTACPLIPLCSRTSAAQFSIFFNKLKFSEIWSCICIPLLVLVLIIFPL